MKGVPRRSGPNPKHWTRDYLRAHPDARARAEERRRQRGFERKLLGIKRRGGKCIKCGYSKNITALHFHHPNGRDVPQSETKNWLRWPLKKFLEEVDKTVLLCSNCHTEEHHPELILEKLERALNTRPKRKGRGRIPNITYSECPRDETVSFSAL